MILKLKKNVALAIGLKKLEAFGLNEEAWSWGDYKEIDLSGLSTKKIGALDKLLSAHSSMQGVGVLRKDIATWLTALKDAGDRKPRTVQQFESLCIRYLEPLPHHHVYEWSDNGTWKPHYVDEIAFHPDRHDRGEHYPAYVSIRLIHEEFGGMQAITFDFYEADVRGYTVVEALARKCLYVETTKLRDEHLKCIERFSSIVSKIGTQFEARGTATTDVDGNPDTRYETLTMERNERQSRVVLDVFYEEDRDHRDSRVHLRTWFWPNKRQGKDENEEESDDDNTEERPQIEIPIHPMLAVFDLVRHVRLRIHISNLTEHVYQTDLADKLILPQEMKDLVTLLVTKQETSFQDIVKGKSGGAVILLAGAPGVGKTLTAEVYAEATSRALYSVQCSQLGIDPEELEKELMRVFSRAARWNAVLLLDEADVYVHERGRDLMQNAIVGVFLRVLEYQDALLFLTTNRPDDVDDAIASRCVARLTYPVPTPDDQCWIWRILADGTGVTLPDDTIVEIVRRNPRLTGRDVKNLLKLARLTPGPITAETIDYVKRFKPTGDVK